MNKIIYIFIIFVLYINVNINAFPKLKESEYQCSIKLFEKMNISTIENTEGYIDFCNTGLVNCTNTDVDNVVYYLYVNKSDNPNLDVPIMNYTDFVCFSSLINIDISKLRYSQSLFGVGPQTGNFIKIKMMDMIEYKFTDTVQSPIQEIYLANTNQFSFFKSNISLSIFPTLRVFNQYELFVYTPVDFWFFFNDLASNIPMDKFVVCSSNVPSFNYMDPTLIDITLGKKINDPFAFSSLSNFNDLTHFTKNCEVKLRVLEGTIPFPFKKTHAKMDSMTIQSYLASPTSLIDMGEIRSKNLILSNVSTLFSVGGNLPFTNFPSSMQLFSFSDGKLKVIPKDINVYTLSIVNNSIVDNIGKLGDYNSRVKGLILTKNNISGVIDESFCELHSFDFRYNNLSSAPKCITCWLPKDPNYSSSLKDKLRDNLFSTVQPDDCEVVPNIDIQDSTIILYGDYMGLYDYQPFYSDPSNINWTWKNYTHYIGTLNGGVMPEFINLKFAFHETEFKLFTSSTPPNVVTVESTVGSTNFIIRGSYFNYNRTSTKVKIGNQISNIQSTSFDMIICSVSTLFTSSSKDIVGILQVGNYNTQFTIVPYQLNTIVPCAGGCDGGICFTNNGTCELLSHYVTSVESIPVNTVGVVQLNGYFWKLFDDITVQIGDANCAVLYVNTTFINCTLIASGSGAKTVYVTLYGIPWSQKDLFIYKQLAQPCPSNCNAFNNQGECNTNNGQCSCNGDYGGADCGSIKGGGDTPQSNVTINPNTGSTTINNQNTNYDIIIVRLLELDFNGNAVESHQLGGNWKLDDQASKDNVFVFWQSIGNCKVTSKLEEINTDTTYNFAGVGFLVESGSLKLSVTISNYSYASTLNSLQLHFESSVNQMDSIDSCNAAATDIDTTGIKSESTLNYVSIKKNKKILNGKFIGRVLSDGKSTSVTTSVVSNENDKLVIGLNLPHCVDSCIVDPDFSVLVSPDFQRECNPSRKWVIPVIVVSVVVGTGVIIALGIFVYKKNQMAIRISLRSRK